MDKKDVDDNMLFLLQQELKCHKATRTILRERLLHLDHLIMDSEKKIMEYVNQEGEFAKDIKNNID
jgi:hypothetical protein